MAELELPRTRAALRAEAKRLREQLALFARSPSADPPRLGDTPPEPQWTRGYNLPSVIRWGQTPASKLSKKGTWYLIIPLTHTTRGYGRKAQQMSRTVHEAARRLQPGQRLTALQTTNSRFVTVPSLQPHQEHLQRSKPGYGRTFVNFVTLTPQSRGWNIPPRLVPPRMGQTEAEAARVLLAAVRADLAARFGRTR